MAVDYNGGVVINFQQQQQQSSLLCVCVYSLMKIKGVFILRRNHSLRAFGPIVIAAAAANIFHSAANLVRIGGVCARV